MPPKLFIVTLFAITFILTGCCTQPPPQALDQKAIATVQAEISGN